MDLANPDAMIEMFESLAPDRQEAVASWFMIQRLIAEHSGISREEWFGFIQEALEHPLDFGFVEDVKPGSTAAADLEKIEDVRQKLGDKTAKTALEGEGIVEASKKGGLEQELLQRFQAQKINFENVRGGNRTRRPNGRTTR
jgi:hypothetical protein